MSVGASLCAQTLTTGVPSPTAATAVSPLTPLPAASTTSGVQNLFPGTTSQSKPQSSLPRVFAPTRPRNTYTRYPWKRAITTTVFWIGELPTKNNPTPNTKSSWDMKWVSSFGGYDDPKSSGREGYRPKKFEPGQNPFYIALPYNDVQSGGVGTKPSARAMVPWFKKKFYRNGRTVLKGRWLAIRRGDKVCYAQWEDVGPFETDDWQYVFGDSRPKNQVKNSAAGLDVSPAVRDYLGFSTRASCDWRFVDEDEVPDGPWKKWGTNNPFAKSKFTDKASSTEYERIVKLKEMRDTYVEQMPMKAEE